MYEIFYIYNMKYSILSAILVFYIPSVLLVDEQLRPRNRTKGRPEWYIQYGRD